MRAVARLVTLAGRCAPMMVGAACLLALGCRDLLGIERRDAIEESGTTTSSGTPGSTGAGGGGGAPTAWSVPAGCDTCVEQACAAEEDACGADPACAEAIDCLLGSPGDPIGRVACLGEHAFVASEATFIALDACLRAPCLDECYQGGDALFAQYEQECQACLATEASQAIDDCVSDASCERAAVEALADPTAIDPRRVEPLFNAVGADGADERALGAAFLRCGDSCGKGQRLDCVAGYDWAPPLPDVHAVDLELELPVLTGPAFDPIPHAGIEVESCELLAGACAPSATFVTNAEGLLAGSLPTVGLVGFRGFFRVSTGSSEQEVFPAHLFPGRPIVGPFHGAGIAHTPERAAVLASAVPGGLPEGKAMVFFVVLDCAAVPARGLTLEVSDAFLGEGGYFYIGDGATGSNGLAGVVGAEPGCFEFRLVDTRGTETHRARVFAAAEIINVVAVYPRTFELDEVHACPLDFPLDETEASP